VDIVTQPLWYHMYNIRKYFKSYFSWGELNKISIWHGGLLVEPWWCGWYSIFRYLVGGGRLGQSLRLGPMIFLPPYPLCVEGTLIVMVPLTKLILMFFPPC
jgi:hypothetical protein